MIEAFIGICVFVAFLWLALGAAINYMWWPTTEALVDSRWELVAAMGILVLAAPLISLMALRQGLKDT